MHWIKAAETDIYLVQSADEVAQNLESAFADREVPVTGKHYMDVAIERCPVPPNLRKYLPVVEGEPSPDGPDSPGI